MRAESLRSPFKLSVFVGSPRRDLEKIRESIIRAILEAGHIPDGMELWASDARPTLRMISDKLDSCDLHVVVLGPAYGEILKNEGISFTHWEYKQSLEARPRRPVISFLLEEKARDQAWRRLKLTRKEKQLYKKLWNELRSNSVCKLYPSVEMHGIEKDVVHSLHQVIDADALQPLAGWIRARSEAAGLATALQSNPLLMRVMERVVGFRATGGRIDTERNAKRAAAATFWDTMMNQLERAGYMDIFLESGSSLAYVSEDLELKLHRQDGWRIATNNALALLQLLLFTDGEVRRNPPVAPDPHDPYGAIFTHECMQAHEEPPIKPRKLNRKELQAIKGLIELLRLQNSKQLILATASGWDTTHKIKKFHGPHVGSHPNMLFKRAIFNANLPVVLFLSRHKVDPRFREAGFKCRTDPGKPGRGTRYCYPVFGEELPLHKALRDTPLALCIGYEEEEGEKNGDLRTIAESIKSILKPHLGRGFDMEYAAKEIEWKNGAQAGAIMVANNAFRKIFPR